MTGLRDVVVAAIELDTGMFLQGDIGIAERDHFLLAANDDLVVFTAPDRTQRVGCAAKIDPIIAANRDPVTMAIDINLNLALAGIDRIGIAMDFNDRAAGAGIDDIGRAIDDEVRGPCIAIMVVPPLPINSVC